MQSQAPSEYFPGIKFNYSFYTTGDTKVTIEYVNNNFLKCVGYAYSRAISTSFNGIIYALGGINTTDIIATGTITANLFQGSGAQITNLNASNISDGTLAVSRGGLGLSTLALGQLLIGNDTNPITQSANLIWDITNNNLGIGKNPAQKLDVNGTIAATLFSGSGASLTGLTEGQIPVLTAAKIPSLDAATKLTGTINNARLPAAISVTSFAGDGASITNINASNIATGTINNARLPAAISVTSFAGDGASITNINATNIAGTIGVANGGTGVTTFGMNRILYGAGGNGAIATLADLTFDGSTLTCYGEFATYKGVVWINNQNSRLSRVLAANQFSTGAAIGDIVLVSDAKLHLVGGSTGTQAPALTVDAVNNIGIGKTNPSATSKLDIVGTTTMTNATNLNLDIVKTSTTAGDLLNMRYDGTNGLRVNQAYVASNDIKQIFYQKNNNVDSTALTIYKGNVGIGTTAPAATDKLSVTGNTKTTGTATIDTNLVVGGSAGIVGTSQFTGNMGIGKASDATLKLDVLGAAKITGDITITGLITANTMTASGLITANNGITIPVGKLINANGGISILTPHAVATTTDLLNMRYNDDWGLRLLQNYSGANNIQYDFINRYNLVNYNALTFKGANLGIGITTPAYKCHIKCSYDVIASGLHLDGSDGGIADRYTLTIYPYVVGGGQVGWRFRTLSYDGGNTTPLSFNHSGSVVVQNGLSAGGDFSAGGTSYLRNTYIYSGNEGTNIGLYFGTPFYGTPSAASKSAIIAEAVSSYSRHHLSFCLNNLQNNNTNVSTSDVYLRLHNDGYVSLKRPLYFMQDVWNNSGEGENRLYFGGSSTTYIRGAGNSATISIVFRSPTQFDMAFFNASVFCCYGPVNLSDRRIKRDIEEINDDDALNKILLVQPTTYYYRDEARNRGNGKVYGFIAQQIKEVIPDAVHTTKDIIANIYKTCLIYNKREIYHSIPQDVAIDTEVHILDKEGGQKGNRYKIKEIYEDYFVIDEDIDGDDCFVFGYMVNDLNALDKSYIYTLNVCATQELHRRIEAQDKRIKELETKIEQLILLSVINNN